jgi:hypothetical protein
MFLGTVFALASIAQAPEHAHIWLELVSSYLIPQACSYWHVQARLSVLPLAWSPL